MLLQKPPLHISHVFNGQMKLNTRTRANHFPLCAVDDREPDFEFDEEKARKALQKLDLELQSLSKKEITQPRKKISAPDMSSEFGRGRQTMKETMPEPSDNDLPYSAILLLGLTVLYNVIFLTIIKPSIDGP
ncbi:hypothetical protein ACHQM5_012491 [Ranunculus cassubicifolius]